MNPHLLELVDFRPEHVLFLCNSSVQDGICALGKAHMRSAPSLRHFPNVAFFETAYMHNDRPEEQTNKTKKTINF